MKKVPMITWHQQWGIKTFRNKLSKFYVQYKKGKAVGGGVSWKNCLKPSGSVFWKEDAHSIAYSKNEEESGCYKEKWKKCQWLLDTSSEE